MPITTAGGGLRKAALGFGCASFLAGAIGLAALVGAFAVGGAPDDDAAADDGVVEEVAGGEEGQPQEERGFLERLTDDLRDAGGGGGAAQPEQGRLANGKPVGLFFMTRFWSYTGTLEKAAWYFSPEGRVYRDLETGFSAADLAAHKGPQGTFEVAGNTMKVTWSDGKTSESEIEPDEPAFTWDMGIFTPVKPFDDAAALAGEWEGGESISAGGNTAAVAKTLRLNADGTFAWDSVSFVKGETGESVLSGGAAGGTIGHWKLDGYSLILTDASGNVLRGITFPYDDEKTPVNPDRFFFAGTMYKKL